MRKNTWKIVGIIMFVVAVAIVIQSSHNQTPAQQRVQQTAVLIYPGYTRNLYDFRIFPETGMENLQNLLKEGWIVKAVYTSNGGGCDFAKPDDLNITKESYFGTYLVILEQQQ